MVSDAQSEDGVHGRPVLGVAGGPYDKPIMGIGTPEGPDSFDVTVGPDPTQSELVEALDDSGTAGGEIGVVLYPDAGLSDEDAIRRLLNAGATEVHVLEPPPPTV